MTLEKMCFLSLLACGLSALATAFWISFSRKKALGQPIRKEGNQAHYKKAGTPTMGGLAFSLLFLVLYLLFNGISRHSFLILASCLAFGGIGFLDDWKKIRKKENEGLTPRQKLLLQFALAGFLVLFAYVTDPMVKKQAIPFFSTRWNLSIFWIPILAFILVGTVNAVNLTDGLDGLCAGVSLPIFLTLALLSLTGLVLYPEVALAGMLFSGLLLGFLFFNSHPASVFMGDTGSMAIGGALCGMLLVLNRLPFLLILGGVYLLEALSVLLQVAYFKKTGGKRIFLMSPIHHHFELKGYAEEKVTVAFTAMSFLLCLVTILLW